MLYFYSQMGINLKFVTSNNPLSVIFISGITGNDKNDNVKKGLKSILDEIAFSEVCKLFKSEITSFDEREVIIPPISREIEAKVLPSLTTIMPPFIFSTYFKTIFIKIR